MPVNSAPTFSVGEGKFLTDLGSSNDRGTSVTLQPDGKILVAGHTFSGGTLDFALVRYNADGSLDTTFDVDGKVSTPVLFGDDTARTVLMQADGKIVVAGTAQVGSQTVFAVVRYNSNGSLDTSFDGD